MKKKKVVYIISDIEKSLSFEWTAQYLSRRYDLFFILIGKKNTPLSLFLQQIQVNYFVVSDSDIPCFYGKWLKIFYIIRKEKPDIVHVHLWRAMLFGITSSWLLRINKRILTRHYATLQYSYYPSGVKWDKLCNWLATDIVAISENVKTVLVKWDNARESKVHVIHHGFDLKYFNENNKTSINYLRDKYLISREKYPVIGVISRYLELKGIQYIIPAFKQILKKYSNAHLLLANTVGDYSSHVKKLIEQLPAGSYTEVEFENDLFSLYKLFDVFVHVPINETSEAFGQTYVEALAMGVPSIFTLSGAAPEFIKHEYNAIVVGYRDSEAIVIALERILEDQLLKNSLINAGKLSVQRFSLEIMISKLESLYG